MEREQWTSMETSAAESKGSSVSAVEKGLIYSFPFMCLFVCKAAAFNWIILFISSWHSCIFRVFSFISKRLCQVLFCCLLCVLLCRCELVVVRFLRGKLLILLPVFTFRVILARSSWRSMMPCTRLRKSLQVGQAPRRKREAPNQEREREGERERGRNKRE